MLDPICPLVRKAALALTLLTLWGGLAEAAGAVAAADPPLEPVAQVLVADPGKDNAWRELRYENNWLLGYRGIAMLDRNTDHPILVLHCFNERLGRMVKIYINWDHVTAFQILDPNIAF